MPEIMDRGMACLVERLGVVETEHFDNVDPDEFPETAYVYDDTHPIK